MTCKIRDLTTRLKQDSLWRGVVLFSCRWRAVSCLPQIWIPNGENLRGVSLLEVCGEWWYHLRSGFGDLEL